MRLRFYNCSKPKKRINITVPQCRAEREQEEKPPEPPKNVPRRKVKRRSVQKDKVDPVRERSPSLPPLVPPDDQVLVKSAPASDELDAYVSAVVGEDRSMQETLQYLDHEISEIDAYVSRVVAESHGPEQDECYPDLPSPISRADERENQGSDFDEAGVPERLDGTMTLECEPQLQEREMQGDDFEATLECEPQSDERDLEACDLEASQDGPERGCDLEATIDEGCDKEETTDALDFVWIEKELDGAEILSQSESDMDPAVAMLKYGLTSDVEEHKAEVYSAPISSCLREIDLALAELQREIEQGGL